MPWMSKHQWIPKHWWTYYMLYVVKVLIGPQPFYIKFNITSLGHERVILGNTWLQENDPWIVWLRWQLIIPCKHLHKHHLGKVLQSNTSTGLVCLQGSFIFTLLLCLFAPTLSWLYSCLLAASLNKHLPYFGHRFYCPLYLVTLLTSAFYVLVLEYSLIHRLLMLGKSYLIFCSVISHPTHCYLIFPSFAYWSHLHICLLIISHLWLTISYSIDLAYWSSHWVDDWSISCISYSFDLAYWSFDICFCLLISVSFTYWWDWGIASFCSIKTPCNSV